ncbi:MAG TPA: hypothetical protein VIG24_05775 [Acidimicrobiia bacterium]
MSLRDEITALNTRRPSRRCVIALILEDLPGEDAAELVEILADESVTHKAIAAALIGRGYDLGRNAKQVARHRRRECECP